ncbi:MAG: Hsp70 family protein, partial [Clostridia bacterium]|nr:Hsp70 family protein [Clostridia bacterium]
ADIDKAIKDAEKYAEEDKKRRQAVEARNGLDQMILSLEQFIRESGDKLPEADKAQLQQEIEAGKKVLEKQDATTEELKAETDRIAQASAGIFQRFYQQAQQNGQPQDGGAGAGAGDGVSYDDVTDGQN